MRLLRQVSFISAPSPSSGRASTAATARITALYTTRAAGSASITLPTPGPSPGLRLTRARAASAHSEPQGVPVVSGRVQPAEGLSEGQRRGRVGLRLPAPRTGQSVIISTWRDSTCRRVLTRRLFKLQRKHGSAWQLSAETGRKGSRLNHSVRFQFIGIGQKSQEISKKSCTEIYKD